MLNELLSLERGLAGAGFDVAPRHADVAAPGRTAALQVRLDTVGLPVELAALDADLVARLWTLRNGKHNSFPYVQLKRPLLSDVTDADGWKEIAASEKRRLLHTWIGEHPADTAQPPFGTGLRESLVRRRAALSTLGGREAAVPAVIDRVLGVDDDGRTFLAALVARIAAELDDAEGGLLDLARMALAGRVVQGKRVGVPLYLDVARGAFPRDVAHAGHAGAISEALSAGSSDARPRGECFLTGETVALHTGNFPQPSVPRLGQIYLFSKNGDIPAAFRYGRADTDGLPIGAGLAQRFAGALDALTRPDLENKAWRGVPGEKPKSGDLLVAFVRGVPDAPIAAALTDGDEEESEEEGDDLEDEAERAAAEARDAFERRTERLISAVRGQAGADFRETPVDLLVLRKVDTGNAKAVMHRALTVGGLYEAAIAWSEARRGLPEWLTLPVPTKGRGIVQRRPPDIPPLELPRATRSLFTRDRAGWVRRERVGMTANDALTLFLGEQGAEGIARAGLAVALARQGAFLAGTAHALRRAGKYERGLNTMAALRTVSLLGLVLARLGRRGEQIVTDVAFRLGQLLAMADVVHIGFCMDERGGQVPPTLLGNSVYATALTNPVRALSILSRRWKAYGSWARRAALSAPPLDDRSKDKRTAKEWAIGTALSQARRFRPIADALAEMLPDRADDRFRAELLLGYVAGMPKAEKRTQEGEKAE